MVLTDYEVLGPEVLANLRECRTVKWLLARRARSVSVCCLQALGIGRPLVVTTRR